MIVGSRNIIVFFALLVFMASFQACDQPGWKGTIAKEGDVTVIRNPKEPLYKTPILELKEEIAIGGSNAQGEYAIGEIRDVVVDDAGIIYALDWQNTRVQVFDQAGKFMRTIGRKGQGPGELELPMTMSFIRNSGEIAVHQATGRYSFFKLDGTFVRQFIYKGLSAVRGVCDSTGLIYLTEVLPVDNGVGYVIKKVGENGSVLATLVKTPARGGRSLNPFLPLLWFRVDRNDDLIYGYPETYEIRFFGANSMPFKKVIRDYDPVAVTAAEKAEQEKIYEGREVTFDFPKYHAAYRWFFMSDLGHILVATYEKSADGKIIHDVFDSEGRFVGRIPLKRMGVGIFKGKYYAREEDDEGNSVLKRYAVTWKIR